MYAHTCVHMHTHIENRGHCLESSSIAFHLFFRLSLIEPRLHRLGWTGWPASLGILLTIALGVTGLHGCGQIFHKCSREWNSGPQTCTANIFLTGLSSRSFHGFRNTVSSLPKMLSTHPWRETYHSIFWGGTAHTGSPSSHWEMGVQTSDSLCVPTRLHCPCPCPLGQPCHLATKNKAFAAPHRAAFPLSSAHSFHSPARGCNQFLWTPSGKAARLGDPTVCLACFLALPMAHSPFLPLLPATCWEWKSRCLHRKDLLTLHL